MDIETALSRREAALRSAATACLAGIALVQAIGLPSLLVQGRPLGVLSMAAMALCVGMGLALATAPADAAREMWGAVAATAVLVLAGWATPHVFAVPGLGSPGWTAMPGAAGSALAAVCLVLALAATRPRRPAARALATAVAVLVALGPGVAALLVALGPGPVGGESALSAGAHVHAQASFERSIELRPGSGRHGSHYVVPVTVAPRQTVLRLVLVGGTALLFVYGSIGYLRRRCAPGAPVVLTGAERGMA